MIMRVMWGLCCFVTHVGCMPLISRVWHPRWIHAYFWSMCAPCFTALFTSHGVVATMTLGKERESCAYKHILLQHTCARIKSCCYFQGFLKTCQITILHNHRMKRRRGRNLVQFVCFLKIAYSVQFFLSYCN